MEGDILSGILEVEKEINDRLEAEREKSVSWLDRVRTEAEQQILSAEEGFRKDLDRSLEESRAEAYRQASGILKRAEADAERTRCISDDRLTEIIRRHIARLLPEGL